MTQPLPKPEPKLAEIDREKAENVFRNMMREIQRHPESAIQKNIDLMVIAGMLGFGKKLPELSEFVAGQSGRKSKTFYNQFTAYANDEDYRQAGLRTPTRNNEMATVSWARVQAALLAGYQDGMKMGQLCERVAQQLLYANGDFIQFLLSKCDRGGLWRKSVGLPYHEGKGISSMNQATENDVGRE